MPGIVTLIKYCEDIDFILEKGENTANKVIILTKEGWYSLNNNGVRFMKLLR
ncbi:MAG TPA: hypothetical protein VHO92_09900 [Methanobacterium sp.]|nr:hypothetical protein [Methanobacterium sp.]